MISIEVVFALPGRQVVEQLQFDSPVTIEQAIIASTVLRQFPEIDLSVTPVGIFGTERPLDWVLENQDRVEIYRPLTMSPTEARRLRAEVKAGR